MTDYDALETEFASLVEKARRDIERAKKRHGVALIRRMGKRDDQSARIVESTWEELRTAHMSLEQAEAGLAGVATHKQVLVRGKADQDLVDLFE